MRIRGVLILDTSSAFVHPRTDEEIHVRAPRDVQRNNHWRLKSATNGARKASQDGQKVIKDMATF